MKKAQDCVRIASQAYMMAAAGPLLALPYLYPPPSDLHWASIVPGLLAGGVAGAIHSRRVARRREAEIEQHGRLLPQERRWWQSRKGALAAVLVVMLVVLLLPLGKTSLLATLNGPFMGGVVDGLGAFFFVWGAHTAWWARRMEKKISEPLYITIRRI